MWKTALFLLFTLLVVPYVTITYDVPLTEIQRDVFTMLIWTYGLSAFLTFVVSTVSSNYSQVDKLWSLMPIAYAWTVANFSGYEPRLILMASLVTIWGLRLTYNFGRRGGYSWKLWDGHEDYRWAVLRGKPEFQAKWKWTLFNLLFISGYQMGLILLFTLPILKCMGSDQALTTADFTLAALFIGFVIMEYIADQQQYDYQQAKYALSESERKALSFYSIGFTHTGLWAYLRHPNYAAEQAIWIVFYGFSVLATGSWINWSIAGCLLLVLLFKGSSDFSESISKAKYPLYDKYIAQVGRFFPVGRFRG